MFNKFGKKSLGFLTMAIGAICVTSGHADLQRDQDYALTRPAVSDQDLANKIQGKINSGWLSKGYKNLNFQVKNGGVTLEGFVKNQCEKDIIEKEIRNMEGVRYLNSQLAVQDEDCDTDSNKPYAKDSFTTSADDQLNKKIRDKTSRGLLWNSYKEVLLNTNNGNVTLTGTVKSIDDQQKLMKEIQKIEGVRSLKSQLDIQAPDFDSHKTYTQDTFTTAADDLLNRKIRDKTSRGWLWNSYEEVILNTNNGNVTLTGTVKSIEDQKKLMKEIQKIEGVRSLKSQLDIQAADLDSQKPYTLDTFTTAADDLLNKKIRDKTSRGWLWNSYEEVVLNTNNGSVTLTGTVKSINDQQKLMKEIQKIEGVRSLISQLDIQAADDSHKPYTQDTFATAADDQLNKKIRDKTSRGWLWNSYKEVILNTKNGNVTLTGSVDSVKDQQKLLKEVQKIEGVKSVQSRLAIKNP